MKVDILTQTGQLKLKRKDQILLMWISRTAVTQIQKQTATHTAAIPTQYQIPGQMDSALTQIQEAEAKASPGKDRGI